LMADVGITDANKSDTAHEHLVIRGIPDANWIASLRV